MKRTIRLIAIIVLLAFVSAPVWSEESGVETEKYYKFGMRKWKPLAEQGNPEAQFNIGLLYREGWGVTQNHKEALKWYKLSAEQGNSEAQNTLGHMYRKGQGITQDYKRAIEWWRLAAQQGDSSQIAEAQKLAREWMKQHE